MSGPRTRKALSVPSSFFRAVLFQESKDRRIDASLHLSSPRLQARECGASLRFLGPRLGLECCYGVSRRLHSSVFAGACVYENLYSKLISLGGGFPTVIGLLLITTLHEEQLRACVAAFSILGVRFSRHPWRVCKSCPGHTEREITNFSTAVSMTFNVSLRVRCARKLSTDMVSRNTRGRSSPTSRPASTGCAHTSYARKASLTDRPGEKWSRRSTSVARNIPMSCLNNSCFSSTLSAKSVHLSACQPLTL